MQPIWIILLAVAGLVLALVAWYVISLFNSLVQVRNNIEKAWANIDVLLQQRHDELNGLMNVVQGYAQHERALFEAVAKLRSGYDQARDLASKVDLENQLNRELQRVGAVAEAYPDLKADQLFKDLQSRITALEDQIADRREFFNDSVNIYNIQIERFPERVFAGILRFDRETFLDIPVTDRAPVAVKLTAEADNAG